MPFSRVRPYASLALLLAACDPPVAVPDGGTDAGPLECEMLPPAFAHGGDGHAEPLGSGVGEVRAGRMAAADFPTTSTGLETWAEGDFVIANDQVALVIEDAGASDLYDRYGGRPVGMALMAGGAMVRPADFNEVLFGISTYLVETERVSVLSDGATGEAIVRATGPLGVIDFAGSLLDSLEGGNFEGEQAAVDYTLMPDSDSIQVSLTVANSVNRSRRASNMLIGFFQSSRMPMYVPGLGFGDATGARDYLGFDDEWGGAGWAWDQEGDLTALLTVSGVGIASLGDARLEPCAATRIELGRIVIGDGIAGVQASIARRGGVALRTLTGTVTETTAGGTPGPVRIHVVIDDAYYTRVPVAADGTYSVEIPMAGTAQVQAYRRGFPLTAVAVPAGADPVADVAMPAFGTIHVVATEDDVGVPSRIQVLPSGGAVERAPDNYGERAVTGGRTHVEFPTDGERTLYVPPGSYRVIVSRGYEYELFEDAVTVAAGATEEVEAALVRSVDTTGVICADYHIHTTRSPDSNDDARLKVASLVADGLEIAVRSDHEYVYDFDPVIEELGLTAYVRGIVGEELTTFAWGHFGVFPLEYDPSRPSGGATSWVGRRPPEVFDEVRARPESPAFIVNHPRSTSVNQGYFEVVGFDAVTGEVEHPEDWDDEFTLIEAFNDSSFRQNRDSTVVDWFAFLAQGRRMFTVGSSDSHSLYGSPIGYPRTCLSLGIDDPTEVTPTAMRDATVAGHSVISGGIYMTVEGPEGSGPGDTVDGAGATAMVHVVVRAAEWIVADTLEVIVDGTVNETITLSRDDVDPTLLLDQMISVPVAAAAMGSYVVFHASGDEDMADLHPGREPFAVSNPLFLTR